MNEIEEIYKRQKTDILEKREIRARLARETVEKENLFNKDPFNNQIKKDWEDSLNKLFIWCYSDWTDTNNYIRFFREEINGQKA